MTAQPQPLTPSPRQTHPDLALFDKAMVGELLTICVREVERLIATQELKSRHIGRRVVVTPADLAEYIASLS